MISGFKIGHADDEKLLSGVTTIIPDEPATAGVHVMGGAPGTRETDLLAPDKLVQKVDGVVLSGGSAFGLDAASGVVAWLKEQDRGFVVGGTKVPIVPAAIVFDLNNGGDKDWGRYPPYRELGYEAASSLRDVTEEGSVGAGMGATTTGSRGGLGIATQSLEGGIAVCAVAVCNAVGSVRVGDSKHFWAAPFEKNDEFGGYGWPRNISDDVDRIRTKGQVRQGEATSLAVVMTNADLDQAGCTRMAINAHDGFARAIYPVHTPTDGDIVFALSSNEIEVENAGVPPIQLFATAANTVTRAIARGVFNASRS